MAIDPSLLDILACPKCKGNVELNEPKDGLLCRRCGLAYPIREEIPVMLIEEAVPMDKKDA